MTTPTISDKLGDFTQIQLGPNLPVPMFNGVPGLTVTIANQDLTNTITIARRNNFTQNGPNTATVPPLGSITVDAGRTIWGLAPAGTLPPLIFPGGGNWAPSPAQVAAQINALGLAKDTTLQGTTTAVNNPAFGPATLTAQTNQNTAIPNNIAATGVPLLALPQNVVNSTNQTVAAGATTVLGPFNVSQIGYEITVSLHSAAVTATFAKVLMTWSDSVTSTTLDRQTWWLIPGADNTTNIHTIKGFGPTEGNQVTITLGAFSNSVVFDQVIMNQNSRVFTRHDWRTYAAGAWAGALGTPVTDMSGMILSQNSATVATAGHYTVYAPLFCGKVQIWGHTSSNGGDAFLQLNPIADQSPSIGALTNLVTIAATPSGDFNVQFYIPRSQLQILFNNTNSVSRTLQHSIQMTDI